MLDWKGLAWGSTVALHLQKNLRSLPRATVLRMTPGEPSAGLGLRGRGLGSEGERAQMQFHNQTPAYLPREIRIGQGLKDATEV
jgi:hypothetical protein